MKICNHAWVTFFPKNINGAKWENREGWRRKKPKSLVSLFSIHPPKIIQERVSFHKIPILKKMEARKSRVFAIFSSKNSERISR